MWFCSLFSIRGDDWVEIPNTKAQRWRSRKPWWGGQEINLVTGLYGPGASKLSVKGHRGNILDLVGHWQIATSHLCCVWKQPQTVSERMNQAVSRWNSACRNRQHLGSSLLAISWDRESLLLGWEGTPAQAEPVFRGSELSRRHASMVSKMAKISHLKGCKVTSSVVFHRF